MAKVVGPLHSSEARGSIGALTYNTWRGISTVKTRCPPTPRDSDDQIAIRALTRACTVAWQAATDAQRTTWNDYAVDHPDIDWTGNPKRISGYNWFVRINVRRQLLELPIDPLPPSDVVNYSIQDLTFTLADGAFDITWTVQDWLPLFTQHLEFYVAGPHSAGRHPNLPESDRKGHATQFGGTWTYDPAPPGWYTVFARPLSIWGLVGVFASVRGQVT